MLSSGCFDVGCEPISRLLRRRNRFLSSAYASAAFLQQTLQLGFDDGAGAITVGGFIADGGKAGFVKQGAPISVHSRLVKPCVLEPAMIKTNSTLTVEMVIGSNAQALIEDVMRQDVGLALDAALFYVTPPPSPRRVPPDYATTSRP